MRACRRALFFSARTDGQPTERAIGSALLQSVLNLPAPTVLKKSGEASYSVAAKLVRKILAWSQEVYSRRYQTSLHIHTSHKHAFIHCTCTLESDEQQPHGLDPTWDVEKEADPSRPPRGHHPDDDFEPMGSACTWPPQRRASQDGRAATVHYDAF